jgi:hypothetical protein
MKSLFCAASLFAVLAYSLTGQSVSAIANIPFDFRVDKSLMPAGVYSFQNSGAVLTVREQDGKGCVMHLTLPASNLKVSTQPKLTFNRYGSEYFLASIWMGNSNEGRTLPTSKMEKELISHFGSRQIALNLHR